ncbi:hypothetical protein VCHA53O466_50496 [Vibrio chagasii]|nr:hypothetical protein VCHA53O466_50496 [Vibrio chagasii]
MQWYYQFKTQLGKFMNRTYIEKKNVQKKIIAALKNGHSLVDAICIANCKPVIQEDNYEISYVEQDFIQKYIACNGSIQPKKKSMGEVVEPLMVDYSNMGDIQLLCAGGSFEEVEAKVNLRRVKRLSSDVRDVFYEEFKSYWQAEFGEIEGLNYSPCLSGMANNKFPLLEDTSFIERLKAFQSLKGYTSAHLHWAILDRTKLEPSGGLRMFVKDRLSSSVDLPPNMVKVKAGFRHFKENSALYEVRLTNQLELKVEVSFGLEPLEVDAIWEDILSNFREQLHCKVSDLGFESIEVWSLALKESPSIKTYKDFLRFRTLSSMNLTALGSFDFSGIDLFELSNAFEESPEAVGYALRLINGFAKEQTVFSRRDRAVFYHLKRSVIVPLCQAGKLPITKVVTRKTDAVECSKLLPDAVIGSIIAPLLVSYKKGYQNVLHCSLRELADEMQKEGVIGSHDRPLKACEYELIGGKLVSACLTWARVYSDTLLYALYRILGGNWSILVRMLDANLLPSGFIDLLPNVGDQSVRRQALDWMRDGRLDIAEFDVGGHILHLPLDLIPDEPLLAHADSPRDAIDPNYRYTSNLESSEITTANVALALSTLSFDVKSSSLSRSIQKDVLEYQLLAAREVELRTS